MKNFIFAISLIFIFLGCSSTNKTVKQKGIKSVKRATVQEIFPGVQNGEIIYKFIFELDLSKDVIVHSVIYNGKTAKLEPFKNESSYTGSVRFKPTEINNFTKGNFIKNEAIIVYSIPNVAEITELVKNITVLESLYMP